MVKETYFDEDGYVELSPDEIESESYNEVKPSSGSNNHLYSSRKINEVEKEESNRSSYDPGESKIINESLDKCNLCGLCKSVCPSYKVTKSETMSPRGRIILLKRGKASKTFNYCTLCGACKVVCPMKVDPHFEIIRKRMASLGKDSSGVKQMLENIRKYKNPYGNKEEVTPKIDTY